MSTKRIPLTKVILSLLVKAGGTAADFCTTMSDLRSYQSAYLLGGHTYVQELKRLKKERDVKRALYQLKHVKYVKARRIGKQLEVSLTEKGLAVTLASQLKQAPKRKHGLTVVVFDIPQTENEARRQFRLLLRQGGFVKLQQSVWVSQKDNYKLLVDFVKKIKLQPWINVFYGSNFLHQPK